MEHQTEGPASAIVTEAEVFDVEQTEGTLVHDFFKGSTIQSDSTAINDPQPLVGSRERQSLRPVPDTMFTVASLPTEATADVTADTVQNDAFAEIDGQKEDEDALCERGSTSGDAVASVSPFGVSAEPPHEGEAVTVNTSDIEPTDEMIPSGGEPLLDANTEVAIPEAFVHHDWLEDDDETATTVVLPDPPSTDPILSSLETITLAEPDTKPSHSEVTPETIYMSLLSPGEVHEQRVSYLIGELPKVAIMVPYAEPQLTNQKVRIQEEKEAEQAAAKIEAAREELERSGAPSVELEAVEERSSAPITVEEPTVPVESDTEGQL